MLSIGKIAHPLSICPILSPPRWTDNLGNHEPIKPFLPQVTSVSHFITLTQKSGSYTPGGISSMFRLPKRCFKAAVKRMLLFAGCFRLYLTSSTVAISSRASVLPTQSLLCLVCLTQFAFPSWVFFFYKCFEGYMSVMRGAWFSIITAPMAEAAWSSTFRHNFMSFTQFLLPDRTFVFAHFKRRKPGATFSFWLIAEEYGLGVLYVGGHVGTHTCAWKCLCTCMEMCVWASEVIFGCIPWSLSTLSLSKSEGLIWLYLTDELQGSTRLCPSTALG